MANPLYNRIVIHYGEMSLKGRKRGEYEKLLQYNIQRHLFKNRLNGKVKRGHFILTLDLPEEGTVQLDDYRDCLRSIPGIVWFAPVRWIPWEEGPGNSTVTLLQEIERGLVRLAQENYRDNQSFRVTANRADKRFPGRCSELQRQWGQTIIDQSPWDRVSLKNPDRTFSIDIYKEGIFLYAQKNPGVGGLPVGSSGRALTLLSGDFDSPVAAFLAAKRGCQVDFVHFTATRTQQQEAESGKIVRLVEQLSRFTQQSRLFLVPYSPFESAIMLKKIPFELVLFRRFMVRTAQALAKSIEAPVLVMGDSLGQVASQTMENLVSIDRSVEIPILRPLITYDKQEIVSLARIIGTQKISEEKYKDCCALLGQNPYTRSNHPRLQDIEEEFFPNYSELIEATLSQLVNFDFDCGKRTLPRSPETKQTPQNSPQKSPEFSAH